MRTEMLAATDETLSGTVTRWLGDFEKALRTSDDASLEALFRADAHWHDLLVFGWQVRTVGGVSMSLRTALGTWFGIIGMLLGLGYLISNIAEYSKALYRFARDRWAAANDGFS